MRERSCVLTAAGVTALILALSVDWLYLATHITFRQFATAAGAVVLVWLLGVWWHIKGLEDSP